MMLDEANAVAHRLRGASFILVICGKSRGGTMSSYHATVAVCALAFASTFAASAIAQQQPASPLVTQINNGNWLPQAEAESLRDELFYQRAIHAYMTMLPALNVIGMRDGSEAAFGKGYNVLPIWKDRMDARTWVPTPNAD